MKLKHILVLTIICFYFQAQAQLTSVSYNDESQKLEGFFSKPKKPHSKKAGIVVLPAWMGITDHEKESAQNLAKLGYYAFVADVYGKDKNPKSIDEAIKQSGFYKTNYEAYQKRIQLAIDQLIKVGANPNEIAVIGYCFGGTGAIEAARGTLKVKGVVSFHGGLGKNIDRTTNPIQAKVLVLHGADDPYVPAKEVSDFMDEMRTANADWQLNSYANAVHAFTHKNAGSDNSKGAAYNEKADKRSWNAMKIFLNEIFEPIKLVSKKMYK